MITQRDRWWWFKLNGAMRHAIARGALNAFGRPVVVTEYPKSGGTWLSQMLAAALDIPYPRNRLPHLRRQIIHGCFRSVHPKADTIVVWRDGRDTMVSFYYHLVFDKPITSAAYSVAVRKAIGVIDPYDIQAAMPRFIQWAFEGGYPGFSWKEFVHDWHGKDHVHQTSYEAVTLDPKAELTAALNALGADLPDAQIDKIISDYSFEAQSNRKRGEEDVTAFVRKGIIGDWKNVFNKEACEMFDRYAGDELILLGYETDRSWIQDQAARSEAKA